MNEGDSPSDNYNRVVNLFEHAHGMGDSVAQISQKLQNITQVTCETMSHAMHASAIVEGTFRAVRLRAIQGNNDILGALEAILEDYGSFLAEYANTKESHIRVISAVETKCIDQGSPFAPFFGDIVRTLTFHCISTEAIAEWKASRQGEEAAGTLGNRRTTLLREIEAIPLTMSIGGLQGLEEADEVARNMGF